MNILVCEDEAPALKHIIKLIRSVRDDAEIVSTAETGEESVEAIHEHEIDLIFMDIELADGPCFETLSHIDIKTPIVFTSAYDKYALNAFNMKCIDYLVKPISKSNIQHAFNKYFELREVFESRSHLLESNIPAHSPSDMSSVLLEKLEGLIEKKQVPANTLKKLFIKNGETIHVVRASEILWIEASGNYITVVTDQKKYLIRSTLSGLGKKLDPDQFCQIHKSTILNTDCISKLEELAYGDYKVILTGGQELKMSRNYNDLIHSF